MKFGTILKNMHIMPKAQYSYFKHQESANKLASTGIFSMVDFNFAPRDTTGRADTLDLHLNLVLDKPYDFYVQGNLTGKTNNRIGPGFTVGLTKRNAFHGGELLDINLKEVTSGKRDTRPKTRAPNSTAMSMASTRRSPSRHLSCHGHQR